MVIFLFGYRRNKKEQSWFNFQMRIRAASTWEMSEKVCTLQRFLSSYKRAQLYWTSLIGAISKILKASDASYWSATGLNLWYRGTNYVTSCVASAPASETLSSCIDIYSVSWKIICQVYWVLILYLSQVWTVSMYRERSTQQLSKKQ